AVDRGVELRGWNDRVDETDLFRARRREARAGEEQLARRRASDLREGERRDHCRQNPQLRFREAEHRIIGGDDDVADGGETGAAPSRVAASHAISSVMTCSLNAFRTSGRLSVRYSTGPRRSAITC